MTTLSRQRRFPSGNIHSLSSVPGLPPDKGVHRGDLHLHLREYPSSPCTLSEGFLSSTDDRGVGTVSSDTKFGKPSRVNHNH